MSVNQINYRFADASETIESSFLSTASFFGAAGVAATAASGFLVTGVDVFDREL